MEVKRPNFLLLLIFWVLMLLMPSEHRTFSIYAQELKKINVACSSLASGADIISIAEEEGFFNQYGLNLGKFYTNIDEKKAVSLLLTGQIDFVLGGAAEGVYASFSGAKIVFLASHSNFFDYKLVVSPLLKDLRTIGPEPKRIGIYVPGGKADLACREIFKKENIDTKAGLKWILMGSDESRTEAIIKGIIDVTSLPIDYALIAKQKGARIFETRKVPFTSGVVQTTRKYIDKNSDTVYSFIKSYAESLEYFFEKKEESISFIRKLTDLEDKALLTEYYDFLRNNRDKVPRIEAEGLKAVIDYLSFSHPEVKNYNAEMIVDHSFLQGVKSKKEFVK